MGLLMGGLLILVPVALLLLGGAAALWYLDLWPFGEIEPDGLHTARFAFRRELRCLTTTLPPPDGLLLGQDQRRRFLAVRPTPERRELGNLLIVGPTRCGKGLHAVAQLLSWKDSVVVNDIKGELYTATAGYRSQLGAVVVIDPTGVGQHFDPLQSRSGEDGLYAAAVALLSHPHDGAGTIFTQRASSMLACLFTAAEREQVMPFPYVRSLIRCGLQAVATRLHTIDPQLATRFLDSPLEQTSFSDRFLLSAWGTLCARLHPLLTETLVRSLAGSDFSVPSLLLSDRPVSVYLRLPERDLLPLAPLTRLLWDSLIGELITTYDVRHGAGCHPVLLLVDEAGRTAIPSLAEHATTVVGRGINLSLYVQSISSLAEVYGRERSQVIRDNMDSQVYFRPGDQATAEYLERCLGRISGFAASETLHDGEQTAEGRSEQAIPLLPAHQIKRLPDSAVLAFHRNLPPMRLFRVDWRDNQELVKRHGMQPPTVAALPPLADDPVQSTSDEAFGHDLGYIA